MKNNIISIKINNVKLKTIDFYHIDPCEFVIFDSYILKTDSSTFKNNKHLINRKKDVQFLYDLENGIESVSALCTFDIKVLLKDNKSYLVYIKRSAPPKKPKQKKKDDFSFFDKIDEALKPKRLLELQDRL